MPTNLHFLVSEASNHEPIENTKKETFLSKIFYEGCLENIFHFLRGKCHKKNYSVWLREIIMDIQNLKSTPWILRGYQTIILDYVKLYRQVGRQRRYFLIDRFADLLVIYLWSTYTTYDPLFHRYLHIGA